MNKNWIKWERKGKMVDNGKMKCTDLSEEQFLKYKLQNGDILFNRTNSIELVGLGH